MGPNLFYSVSTGRSPADRMTGLISYGSCITWVLLHRLGFTLPNGICLSKEIPAWSQWKVESPAISLVLTRYRFDLMRAFCSVFIGQLTFLVRSEVPSSGFSFSFKSKQRCNSRSSWPLPCRPSRLPVQSPSPPRRLQPTLRRDCAYSPSQKARSQCGRRRPTCLL